MTTPPQRTSLRRLFVAMFAVGALALVVVALGYSRVETERLEKKSLDALTVMVAKVDRDEVLAGARPRIFATSLLVGLGLFLAADLTGHGYRRRQVTLQASLDASEIQRHKTQEEHHTALRESEERLGLALAAANHGMYDLQVQTGEGVVSAEYARMLGYDPAQFRETLTAWRERLHPDDREEACRVHEDCLAGRREELDIEFRQRTKGGDWKWIRSRGKLVSSSIEGLPLRLVGTHADITERKRAEEALRASEERFRIAAETTNDVIYEWDLKQGVRWVGKVDEMLGYEPGGFSRTLDGWAASVHPEDLERTMAAVQAHLDGRAPYSEEYRVRRKDGVYRWWSARGAVARTPDGRPVRWIGSITDVTERKRVDDALRLFRSLLDQSTDAIEVVDPDTARFLDVNEKSCLDLGYSREELLALSVPDVDPTLDISMVTKGMDTLRNAGALLVQSRHRRKNGSTFPVEVHITYVSLGRAYLVCVVRDITERVLAAATLHLQAAALNAAADAIVITDRNGVIQWVNPAFTQLTGYSAEEALGQNPRDLVKSGEHGPAFYQEFWNTILAGQTWRGSMTNRRKDGRLYSEEQTVTPIQDASGAVIHFVAIKKDTTERLQLETQFRHAQKMECVGRLASGIAHDFNNLLTVINGTSDLVLAQVSPDDPVRADLDEILRAGERAAALTRQLLAFSRQQVLAPRVLNVNAIITGMEGLLRRLLGEDIDLVVTLAPSLNLVKADPGQIEQVISNVAVNARDAMPQGGRLTIETQNVTIDESAARRRYGVVSPGSYVQLAVSDSGAGMDEATRTRVFEPFFTTKDPGRGTGLGLSTVFGIVKQSHGFVWLDSEVDHGTTFTFWLPQATEAAGTYQPTPIVVSGSGTETILLVEDNAGLRKLAARILEPAGYTVLQAATGEEALSVLERQEDPVHLLLSDVVMPGISGRQLAEQLAQTRPEIKALYMSGYTEDTVVRHGVLDGQMAFLQKPFTAATLCRKIREVLDASA